MEGGPTNFDEEIEPFCRWRRTQDLDVLELHLPPGMKKEHLKIQINNSGILTLTGRYPVEQTKSIKFIKETKVAQNCRRNEIRAKYSKGVLYVTMPKTSPILASGAPSVPLKGVTSETDLNPKEEDSNYKSKVAKFTSKFGSLRQRLWRKTVVEGIAAVLVVAAAVVGVVKLYQLVMASPV